MIQRGKNLPSYVTIPCLSSLQILVYPAVKTTHISQDRTILSTQIPYKAENPAFPGVGDTTFMAMTIFLFRHVRSMAANDRRSSTKENELFRKY